MSSAVVSASRASKAAVVCLLDFTEFPTINHGHIKVVN